MHVSKQEFDAHAREVTSSFERLQSDVKSSYASIIEYLTRLEAHNRIADEKFDALEAHNRIADEKFDAPEAHNRIADEKFDALEAHNRIVDEKFDALEAHNRIVDEKFDTLKAHNRIVDEKFNRLETKFDRMDQRLTHLADDVSYMRSNFGGRFDVISGQLRLIDQGQFRTEERLSALDRLEQRVNILEDKAS